MMDSSKIKTPMYGCGDTVFFTLNMPCCGGLIAVTGTIEIVDRYGEVRYDVLGRFMRMNEFGKQIESYPVFFKHIYERYVTFIGHDDDWNNDRNRFNGVPIVYVDVNDMNPERLNSHLYTRNKIANNDDDEYFPPASCLQDCPFVYPICVEEQFQCH